MGRYTGSPSPYGTFDQGRNAWEWNEAVFVGLSGCSQLPDFVDRYLAGRIKLDELVSATTSLEKLLRLVEMLESLRTSLAESWSGGRAGLTRRISRFSM